MQTRGFQIFQTFIFREVSLMALLKSVRSFFNSSSSNSGAVADPGSFQNSYNTAAPQGETPDDVYDDANEFWDDVTPEMLTKLEEDALASVGKPSSPPPVKPPEASRHAFDLEEMSVALEGIGRSSDRFETPTLEVELPRSELPSVIKRLNARALPIKPRLTSGESPGTYGYRYEERRRLESEGLNVGGGSRGSQGEFKSTFESDHMFSFATTHPYPIKRDSPEGKTAAGKGVAYYEFGDLHRKHISSQNTHAVDSGDLKINKAEHGWYYPGIFRNHVRTALRDRETMSKGDNLSNAAQLHLLDYGFMHRRARENGSSNGAYPNYETLRAARNSFGYMLKNAPPVHFIDNPNSAHPREISQTISPKARAELILAHQAVVESRYPDAGDTEKVVKGVLSQEEHSEKLALWKVMDNNKPNLAHYDDRDRAGDRVR
jgi:hypothetical protein